MTKRTEWQHRVAEAKARLMTKVANILFATRTTPLTKFIKKIMGVDQAAEYTDPDLEHPP